MKRRETKVTLSAEQAKTIALAALDVPNKMIAGILGVTIKTVEKARTEAYKKLKVQSGVAMTHWAIGAGLVPLQPWGNGIVFIADQEYQALMEKHAGKPSPWMPIPIKQGPIGDRPCRRLNIETMDATWEQNGYPLTLC